MSKKKPRKAPRRSARSGKRAPVNAPASSGQTKTQVPRMAVRVPQVSQPSSPDGTVSSRTASAAPAELAKEYTYVLSDLRRIAIVAASMFALLIILALIVT